MKPPTALVVAKAPVANRAKTRLAAEVGATAAARIAAAALLDTLEVVSALDWPVVVALTGDLSEAEYGEEIVDAITPHRVVWQRGEDFGARLAGAHADADTGHGVVQVGMDTPHVDPEHLRHAGDALREHDAALGHAMDGGWWVLGVRSGGLAGCLRDVPMSRSDTGEATVAALAAAGATVAEVPAMSDVDTWDTACVVAGAAPRTRFAAEVARARDLIPEAGT